MSPSNKNIKHQSASSHARLSYMSPESQLKWKQNQKIQKNNTRQKLHAYEHTELPLDAEQDKEMDEVVIEQECSGELQELFIEGEKHGVGSKLQDVWKNDKQREDQLINSKLCSTIKLKLTNY